jgi:ADP-ribose pyrophosphatase YjhB (NUDIX family)
VTGGADVRPEVCVGAVVIHDGRLLLVQRGRGAGQGLWSIPGGRVEGGERMTDAVAREVLEETGLAVETGQWVGCVERIGADHHFVIHDYTAALAAGVFPHDARAADDAAALRWDDLTALADAGDLVPGLLSFLVEHGLVPVSDPSTGADASRGTRSGPP